MPQRKRTQQIEEESRRAFADALGSTYLFRDEVPDFSIDGGVEEFGADHEPTGLRYFVQLKATDGPRDSRHMAGPIKIETASYYHSLPLPVLMVRYFSVDKSLYAGWFHGLAVASAEDDEPQKTVSFRWQPEDEMSDGTPARLAAEARSYLELRSSRPPLPFPFALRAPSGMLGITPAELSIALGREARNRADVVDLRSVVPDGSGYFVADNGQLAVELPGVRSASYELSESYEPGPGGSQLAVDLLTLAAVAFARWGQADAAGRLARAFFSRSTLAGRMQAALVLSSEMARARQVREALAIADELDALDDPDAGETSFVFTLPVLHNSQTLSDDEASLYRATLQRRIERRENGGDLLGAAREYVNLSNHHRQQRQPKEAAEALERAASCDPEYRDRLHYWEDLSGMLFLSQRYDEAVDAYARSIELGAGPFNELLHADALLFAGRFEKARDHFVEALENQHGFGYFAEYRLKQFLLDALIKKLDITDQERDRQAAARIVGEVHDAEDADDVQKLMIMALLRDGLCAGAWWNLAHAYREQGDEAVAASLFISAALCFEGDVEAWALATSLTWMHGDVDLVPLIFITGNRMTDGKLLDRLAEIAAEQLDADDRQEFLAGLEKMQADFADLPSDNYAVRGVNPGQKVDITVLPGATTASS